MAVFNDQSTADVILKSSDGVSFYAHKTVLSAYSGTFADADTCSKSSNASEHSSHTSLTTSTNLTAPLEVVVCSERAEILDPLIRFMYRDETQLNLHAMHRQDFFLFADAAEKYDVWSLKQLLRTFMTCEYMDQCPLAILKFAVTHGYTKLGVDAAVVAMRHMIQRRPLSYVLTDEWINMKKALWATDAFFDELTPPPPSPEHTRDVTISVQSKRTSISLDGSPTPRPKKRKIVTQTCDLWDPFYDDIQALSGFAARACVPAIDVPMAFMDGAQKRLEGCNVCTVRAEKWIGQYVEGKRDRLEAVLVGRDGSKGEAG